MAYFYGVYINDKKVAGALEAIRFLMQPDAVRFAHVTVRGPYQRRLSNAYVKDDLTPQVRNWELLLVQPGCFFGDGQNTVYLNVELGQLRQLWHKPHYPRGVAHLTLYDGNDRKAAKALYQVIARHHWNLRVDVSGLRIIDEKHAVEGTLFNLLQGFMDSFSLYFASRAVLPSEVGALDLNRRLEMIQHVVVQLGCPLEDRSDRHRPYPAITISTR